jgi:hypothetical protein
MRGLFGDFSTMPLKDLVVYLGNKQATGTLNLEREGVRKTVLLKDGQIVGVSSNEPREYLGQFLINMGHITEEQLAKAFETQKQTKIFLGKILSMIGLVPEDVVTNALSLKMRETLLDAFNWPGGTFDFDASIEPEIPDGLHLQIALVDVHREGEFRETAWQAIRAVFPHGRLRLEVNRQNLPAQKPGTLDERLVMLIEQGNSIDEMVLALHATDFFLYQRLYALYRLEAVRVAEGGPGDGDEPLVGSEVVGDEASPEELMGHAEAFLQSGNARDAEALARKIHDATPSPAATELLRRAEAALLHELVGAYAQPGQCPRLAIDSAQMKELQLTAPERYLLSRLNGEREAAAVVKVSPIKPLEALKLLQKFYEAGWIAY